MLDQTDRRLLTLLQQDARLTAAELGEALSLSASQAARRRQRLEADGFIARTSAHVVPERLGLSVQAFVQIHLSQHGASAARDFAALVQKENRVINAWTMTGDADYILHIWCVDLADLSDLIQNVLLTHPTVSRVHSQIALDQLKTRAPLPI